MESITVALTTDELKILKKICDEQFPFFNFFDDGDKVKSAIEYLVEREVSKYGYDG